MKTPKIPSTEAIQELARFWDVHDLTDFEDVLEEMPASVFERRAGETVTSRQRARAIEEDFQIETQVQPGNTGSIIFTVIVKELSNEQNTLARVTSEFTLSGRQKFGDDFLRVDAEKSAVGYVKELLRRAENRRCSV